MTELCLQPGSGIRLSPQHNCQGAGQPSQCHIGGGELVREGGRVTRRASGEGRVVRYCTTQRAWELEVEGVKMLLGYWWLEAAARGALPFLPIVNIRKHNHVKSGQTPEKDTDAKEHVLFEDSKIIGPNEKTTQVLMPAVEENLE